MDRSAALCASTRLRRCGRVETEICSFAGAGILVDNSLAKTLLLGEAKWSERPFTEAMIEEAARALLSKRTPRERWAHVKRVVHALFVPRRARMRRKPSVGSIAEVFTADHVLAALR